MQTLSSETEVFDAIFNRSTLILTDEDRAKLKAATISINGLGGIGGIVVEELVRSGIGHLKLSDPDVFEPTNLGRQLYATTETLGRNKVEVATERVLEVDPYCNVEAYPEGVQKENIYKILQGADIVVDEVDIMSRHILLHRAAKEMRIPLVHGCRAGFPGDRWTVQVWVWNYRDYPATESLEEKYKLWTCSLSWDELTDDVLKRVDEELATSRKQKIRAEIIKGNTSSFGNVSHEYLLSKIDSNLGAIFVQIPNTVGILVSLEAVKVILGWKTASYRLNLLRGCIE